MSAPAGNDNASKWTHDQTMLKLDQIEQIALDEFAITLTLTHALLRAKCYKQLWSYWKKKWESDGDIMDRIYYIEQIFMHKLEDGALFKRLNASTCHFILKNNYGYNAKDENELPAHLRHEFAPEVKEKAFSGSKSKKDNGEEPYTQAELDYINDPAYTDFSDRETDDDQMKWFRADARKYPHLYTAKIPVRGNYIKIAEDLYSPI
ncbi:MAG: hypothetical protein JST76_15105 [Bacteroidetes bacterium]|nr:hypothetical protein [Bacteroidota bacterium]